MDVLVGIDALVAPADGTSLTIGTFDGVHLGHRSLIARAVAHAAELGAKSGIVTWDRHPSVILRPDRVPPLLTTPERKLDLLRHTGVDVIAVLPFTDELSHWPPEKFVADVLVAGLGARHVSVGQRWRFGHKAAGTVELLTELGSAHGFGVEEVDLAHVDGGVVSSSRVRRAVTEGDLASASALLGRPFDVDGTVIHGDDRGARLGFPTANMAVDAALAHPPRGVYACFASVVSARRDGPTVLSARRDDPTVLSARRDDPTVLSARRDDPTLDGARHEAAVNVGVNPTFGGDPATTPLRIEAYLIDFDGDLYGRTLRIEFVQRLRDEIAFPSPDELVAQMKRDVEDARAALRKA
jgi:riboflavin kinase/FMN adenylyltransferase